MHFVESWSIRLPRHLTLGSFIDNAEFSDFYCTYSLLFFCYTWEPKLIMVQEMKTWHLEQCLEQEQILDNMTELKTKLNQL